MPTIEPGTALDRAARERLDALIALVRSAERRLASITRDLATEGQSAAWYRARLREADRIADDLLRIRSGQASGALVDWARENVGATYAMGARRGLRDLAEQMANPAAPGRTINIRAVNALLDRYVQDATELVVQLHVQTIRASRVVLAQAGFGQDIAAGIIGGLPRRTTSRALADSLRRAVLGALPPGSKPDLSHVEIGGRRFRVDAWVEMHARTETARVANVATSALSISNGVGHVQVTSHAHRPCICTPWEGRIYSLQRGDPRFLWIGETPGGSGPPFHPNCVHRLAPAVVELLEERNEIDGHVRVPAAIRDMDERELARWVRSNSEQLRPFAESRDRIMPEGFRVRKAA